MRLTAVVNGEAQPLTAQQSPLNDHGEAQARRRSEYWARLYRLAGVARRREACTAPLDNDGSKMVARPSSGTESCGSGSRLTRRRPQETYNRTPPPTPSSKQRSKSSSTATLSAPSSASPATASSSNQPRASPVASTSKALTPEEAQKLFEDESTCRQPWMRSESRGGWERFAENRAEVVSFAEQEETPLDATGETGGGQDTDEVGESLLNPRLHPACVPDGLLVPQAMMTSTRTSMRPRKSRPKV